MATKRRAFLPRLVLLLLINMTPIACFSGHMLGFPSTSFLITEGPDVIGISEVKVGDFLLSFDLEGKLFKDEVIAILISDPDAVENFLQLKLLSGEELEVRPKNLIYEYTEGGISSNKYAKEMKVGTQLITLNRHLVNPVVERKIVQRRGVYLPLTRSGKIFVNGVLVSCFGLVKTQIVPYTFYKYYTMGIEYLPNWISGWTHFNIKKKHWTLYFLESLFSVLETVN